MMSVSSKFLFILFFLLLIGLSELVFISFIFTVTLSTGKLHFSQALVFCSYVLCNIYVLCVCLFYFFAFLSVCFEHTCFFFVQLVCFLFILHLICWLSVCMLFSHRTSTFCFLYYIVSFSLFLSLIMSI